MQEAKTEEYSAQASVHALIDQLHKEDVSIAKDQVELCRIFPNLA